MVTIFERELSRVLSEVFEPGIDYLLDEPTKGRLTEVLHNFAGELEKLGKTFDDLSGHFDKQMRDYLMSEYARLRGDVGGGEGDGAVRRGDRWQTLWTQIASLSLQEVGGAMYNIPQYLTRYGPPPEDPAETDRKMWWFHSGTDPTDVSWEILKGRLKGVERSVRAIERRTNRVRANLQKVPPDLKNHPVVKEDLARLFWIAAHYVQIAKHLMMLIKFYWTKQKKTMPANLRNPFYTW